MIAHGCSSARRVAGRSNPRAGSVQPSSAHWVARGAERANAKPGRMPGGGVATQSSSALVTLSDSTSPQRLSSARQERIRETGDRAIGRVPRRSLDQWSCPCVAMPAVSVELAVGVVFGADEVHGGGIRAHTSERVRTVLWKRVLLASSASARKTAPTFRRPSSTPQAYCLLLGRLRIMQPGGAPLVPSVSSSANAP